MALETVYGVTPQGFRRKTLDEIKAELEADQRADIHPEWDVSADQVAGQMNGTFARQLGIAWEVLEVCYHGNDPDAAEDRLLDMLAKMTGTFRSGNTPSEVDLVCNLDAGTELVPDEAFAAVRDQPDIRWTPVEAFTAPVDGSYTRVFRSEQLGPVQGFAGTIDVIGTPIVGWNSVVNPNDAELGKLVDKDPEFRLRRERELAVIGSANVRAVTAAVSQAFASKLLDLIVYENEEDFADADGRPPHSLEVVVFDGDVPSIDDDELAQVIHDRKAGGIKAFGATFGTAKALVNGVETDKRVGFSRGARLLTYLTFTITKGPGYVGDDAVKKFVATTANAKYQTGEDVVALVLKSMPLALAGVADVTVLKLGFAPSPTNEGNLAVGVREVARFSSDRIVVTGT